MAVLVAAGILAGCGGAHGAQLDTRPQRPVFDCQEDELMVWRDAPTIGLCVNVEEFVHAAHALAGHAPASPEDERLAPYVATHEEGGM
jgi:hypothetical protein